MTNAERPSPSREHLLSSATRVRDVVDPFQTDARSGIAVTDGRGEVLKRAATAIAGQILPDVTVDEVYLLMRGLAQACATTPTAPHPRRRVTLLSPGATTDGRTTASAESPPS